MAKIRDVKTTEMLEVSWEYKENLLTLSQAIEKMAKVSGLSPDVAESMLRGLNRDKIVRLDFNKRTRNGKEARRTIGPGPKLD